MNYNLKLVRDGVNENVRSGYQLYTDDNGIFYSVIVKADGSLDMTSWASLLNNYLMERDMPIFTREYCEFWGKDRETYETVTIIEP